MDAEIAKAIHNQDIVEFEKQIRRLDPTTLLALFKYFEAQEDFLSSALDKITTWLPCCHCGEFVPCEKHSGSLALWEAENLRSITHITDKTEFLRLWNLFKDAGYPGYSNGKCYVPGCGLVTDSDYDGGYYVFCDAHNGLLFEQVWSKPAGEYPSYHHKKYRK